MSKTVRVTLKDETYEALKRLGAENNYDTVGRALGWLANYAVMCDSLCPRTPTPNMPVDEVLQRIRLALTQPAPL